MSQKYFHKTDWLFESLDENIKSILPDDLWRITAEFSIPIFFAGINSRHLSAKCKDCNLIICDDIACYFCGDTSKSCGSTYIVVQEKRWNTAEIYGIVLCDSYVCVHRLLKLMGGTEYIGVQGDVTRGLSWLKYWLHKQDFADSFRFFLQNYKLSCSERPNNLLCRGEMIRPIFCCIERDKNEKERFDGYSWLTKFVDVFGRMVCRQANDFFGDDAEEEQPTFDIFSIPPTVSEVTNTKTTTTTKTSSNIEVSSTPGTPSVTESLVDTTTTVTVKTTAKRTFPGTPPYKFKHFETHTKAIFSYENSDNVVCEIPVYRDIIMSTNWHMIDSNMVFFCPVCNTLLLHGQVDNVKYVLCTNKRLLCNVLFGVVPEKKIHNTIISNFLCNKIP